MSGPYCPFRDRTHGLVPMAGRVAAISDDGGFGIIKALPRVEQVAILERIVQFPPNREVQIWARHVYCGLTEPENDNG